MSDQVLGLAARINSVLDAPNVSTFNVFPLISDADWQAFNARRTIVGLGEIPAPDPFVMLTQQWALIPTALAEWERVAIPLDSSADDLERSFRADHRAQRQRQQNALLEIPPGSASLLQVAVMGLWKVGATAALLMAAQDAEHLAESVPLGEAKDLRAAAESKRATAGEISEAIDLLGDDWREYVLNIQPPALASKPVPEPTRIGSW